MTIALYIHNHHTVCFTVFNPPILYSLRSNKSDSVWLFSRGVCGFFINFIKRNFQKRQDINTHFTLPLSYTLLCLVYWPGVHIQQDFNLFSWSLIQVAVFIGLAPVVQKVDNAIHWINHYPLDSAIGFPNTYPWHSDLSIG